jgi:protein gp37
MAKRLQAMGTKGYKDGFKITAHAERLTEPLRWRKPRRVFVCSMGDLFHQDIPYAEISKVFGVMAWAKDHTFFVLTKRPQAMMAYLSVPDRIRFQHEDGKEEVAIWPYPNVRIGVSVENQARAFDRIAPLLHIPAAHRFVSVEPMLGPVNLEMYFEDSGLDWVICGGESGPGRREMDPDWARDLRDQCINAGIPFHFKQHSGPYPGYKPELDGVRHRKTP